MCTRNIIRSLLHYDRYQFTDVSFGITLILVHHHKLASLIHTLQKNTKYVTVYFTFSSGPKNIKTKTRKHELGPFLWLANKRKIGNHQIADLLHGVTSNSGKTSSDITGLLICQERAINGAIKSPAWVMLRKDSPIREIISSPILRLQQLITIPPFIIKKIITVITVASKLARRNGDCVWDGTI